MHGIVAVVIFHWIMRRRANRRYREHRRFARTHGWEARRTELSLIGQRAGTPFRPELPAWSMDVLQGALGSRRVTSFTYAVDPSTSWQKKEPVHTHVLEVSLPALFPDIWIGEFSAATLRAPDGSVPEVVVNDAVARRTGSQRTAFALDIRLLGTTLSPDPAQRPRAAIRLNGSTVIVWEKGFSSSTGVEEKLDVARDVVNALGSQIWSVTGYAVPRAVGSESLERRGLISTRRPRRR